MDERKPYQTPRIFERVVHYEGPDGFGVALCGDKGPGLVVIEPKWRTATCADCQRIERERAARRLPIVGGAR
jgi:hypothetical protein